MRCCNRPCLLARKWSGDNGWLSMDLMSPESDEWRRRLRKVEDEAEGDGEAEVERSDGPEPSGSLLSEAEERSRRLRLRLALCSCDCCGCAWWAGDRGVEWTRISCGEQASSIMRPLPQPASNQLYTHNNAQHWTRCTRTKEQRRRQSAHAGSVRQHTHTHQLKGTEGRQWTEVR